MFETPADKTIDIDFLPASYREQGAKRKTGLWRLLVVAVFGSALVPTGMYQRRLKQEAEIHLAHLESLYPAAMARNAELSSQQSKLAAVQTAAELATYLRHPWPRTQILAAIAQPLPDTLTLHDLQILRENVSGAAAAPPSPNNATPAAPTNPVAADLERLRNERESTRLVVAIGGATSEVGALHEYLGKLAGNRLFQKVELGSIESSPAGDHGLAKFSVRIIVRPAPGQPGAPPPPQVAAAATPGGTPSP